MSTQAYTYYAWVDAENVIREGGFCPTDGLGEYPNWQRTNGWRFLEHNLPELVLDATHYVDTDGTIKRRELPTPAVDPTPPLDRPPPPRRI